MMRRILLAALLAAAATADAARLNICGFETSGSATASDNSEVCVCGTTWAVQSTTKRSGTYALRINPGIGVNGYVRINPFNATNGNACASTVSIAAARWYMYIATAPTADCEVWGTATSSLKYVSATGKLRLYNGVTALGSETTTTISTSTWYRIEVRSNGTNSWAVDVNGATEASGTDAVTQGVYHYFGRNATAGGAIDIFYDDVAIDDANAVIGEGRVVMLKPNANGTDTAFTAGAGAGDYTDTDDPPADPDHDSATTYSTTSTAGTQAESHNVTDTASAGIPAGSTIRAVKSMVVTRDNSGSTNTANLRIRSGGTAYDLTAVDGDGTWQVFGRVDTTNPNGGAAWTATAVDGLQVGVVKTQSQARARDFTMAVAMVEYWPATAPQSIFYGMP